LMIMFQAEPNQLLLTTYDPANGASLSEKIVPLKKVTSDFYSVPVVLGWHTDLVYFILDSRVYALDVTTGELVMEYQ